MRRRLFSAVALAGCGLLVSCGGSNSSTTPVSKLKYRAFVANQFSSVLYVVDETDDQLSTRDPSIAITDPNSLGAGPTQLLPAGSLTLIVSQSSVGPSVEFLDNTTESQSGAVAAPGSIDSIAVTPDDKFAYVASQGNSSVYVINIANKAFTSTTIPVAGANSVVASPDSTTVLAFGQGLNTATVIKVSDNSTQTVSGFNYPVGAVFSSDSKTAYVLNCASECGAAGSPTVTKVDLSGSTPAVIASLPVDGATVGMLDASGNLYVAGTPAVGNGVLDVINLSSFTVTKTAPIGDGYHKLMALTAGNKLYIGARTCTITTTASGSNGCLSSYDPSSGKTAVLPLSSAFNVTSGGNVTGMQPVSVNGRNVLYVAQGGEFVIYDVASDTPQQTQIDFSGIITDVKSAQ